MSKFNIGDMVEFIPGNYEFSDRSGSYWLEGTCLVLDIEEEKYVLHVFHLEKISIKNFASYDIGQTVIRIPVKDSDQQNCLKALEL